MTIGSKQSCSQIIVKFEYFYRSAKNTMAFLREKTDYIEFSEDEDFRLRIESRVLNMNSLKPTNLLSD